MSGAALVHARYGTASMGIDLMQTVFYPGKEQLSHRQTELLWRENAADAAPPRGHVDLDRGVARLTMSAPGAAAGQA